MGSVPLDIFFCLLLLIYKHLNNILQSIFPPKKKKKDSKFTNDMDFWTFSFTLVLFCAS